MTLNELKRELKAITEAYFANATVAWAQTKHVTPIPALVTLRTYSVERPLQPISIIIDGVPCGYYPSRTILEVNLFTKGELLDVGQGMTVPQVNTAENDLVGFCNYIDSPEVTKICSILDIAIMRHGEVKDISGLINDVEWDYRAMVEFDVDFTQVAVGAMGVLSESSIKTPDGSASQVIDPEWSETASGGGSESLASVETGYFEKVDIKEE